MVLLYSHKTELMRLKYELKSLELSLEKNPENERLKREHKEKLMELEHHKNEIRRGINPPVRII